MKPIVYIASPYTKGDPAINTRCQMAAFHELMDDGLVWPVAPLLSHFLHIFRPRNYRDWIDYDLAIISTCDACLRIDAEHGDYLVTESSGADGEVAEFQRQGKPVFYDKELLYAWAESGRRGGALVAEKIEWARKANAAPKDNSPVTVDDILGAV